MLIQSTVGPSQNNDGNTGVAPRLGRQADTMVSQLHGKYYEASRTRTTFRGSALAVTTTVGFATTYTGLVLANPFGSNVNAVVLRMGYGNSVAFATAGVIGVMKGYSSATQVVLTTPVQPYDSIYTGSYSGVCVMASAATLPATPVLHKVVASCGTANTNTYSLPANNIVELEGDLILPPGAFCAVYTSVASGTNGMYFDLFWEEVPV